MKGKERKLKVSVSNITDAVASFLIASSVINDNEDITALDIPLKHKDGIVEVTLTVTERN